MNKPLSAIMSSSELRRSFWDAGFFARFFRGVSKQQVFNLYAESMKLAGEAYHRQCDKGSEESLWHHIDDVVGEIETRYKGTLPDAAFTVLKAKAILHEVLEVKGPDGKYLYAPKVLAGLGFPQDFVDSLSFLGKAAGEPYLMYVHRLARSGDRHAFMVKDADWTVNSKNRSYDSDVLPESVLYKKRVLYPGCQAYLRDVADDLLDPHIVTPFQYVLDKGLDTAEGLKKHWVEGHSRRVILASPVAAILGLGMLRQSGPR